MATEKPTPKAEDNPDNGPDDQLKKSENLISESSSDKVEVDDKLEDSWGTDFDTEKTDEHDESTDSYTNSFGDPIIERDETDKFDVSSDFDTDPFGDPTLETEKTIEPDKRTDFEFDDSEDDSFPSPEPSYNGGNIDYTYDENRSYFFVFGPSYTGKTAFLLSLYRYLKIKRIGDSFKNINDPSKSHERIGNILIRQFDEYGNTGDFPPGTTKLAGTDSELPIHLNYKFNPNPQLKKPGFEFCLMDLAGEDLAKIDFESKESLPDSIRTYFEDLPNKHLRFIYVIDPVEEYASKIEQIQLFSAFTNLIDHNNHTSTPILILVSKWDTVVNYSTAQEYIEHEYPEIWGQINNPERQIEFGRFSIGKVVNKKIIEFDFTYTSKIFNWIYRQHTGEKLDDIDTNTQASTESWLGKLINKLFK